MVISIKCCHGIESVQEKTMTFSLFKKSLQDKQDIHLIKMSDCRFEKNIPTKIYLNFFHFIRCTNTHALKKSQVNENYCIH